MHSQKVSVGSRKAQPEQPARAMQRRRQAFHMGPVSLSITSVMLIGLMAVLYISQVGQAVAANQKLQTIHSEQAILLRQNQDLMNSIAQEQSPGYIADNAQKQGLIPADPKNVWVLPVDNLQAIPKHDVSMLP